MIEQTIKENLDVMVFFQDEAQRDFYFSMLQDEVDSKGIDINDSKALTDLAIDLTERLGLTFHPKV